MWLTAKIAAAALVLILGGLVLACDPADPPGEVATARLLVDPGPDPSIQDLVTAEATAVRYAAQAESRSVAHAVVMKLGLERSARDLQGVIDTDVDEETLELTIEVRDEDPEAARVLALALGNEMIERVEGIPVEQADGREAESIWRCIPAFPASCIVTSTDSVKTSSSERTNPSVARYLLVWAEKPAAPEAADG